VTFNGLNQSVRIIKDVTDCVSQKINSLILEYDAKKHNSFQNDKLNNILLI
jgi:hypothetical protein